MEQRKTAAGRRAGYLLLTVILCVCALAGCAGKLTPKKLMASVSENMKDIRSFSSSVELDIELEDVLHTTKVFMDMDMENTMEPKAGHALGTARVTMRGAELESVLEIYQVTEDGQNVTYSSLDGQWSRETAEQDGSSGVALDGSLFAKMEASVDEFRIAEQTTEVGGKECYQMYGEVSGRDLMGLLGSEMLHAYSLVELPDEEAIVQSQFPVTLEVYTEELLPARIIVNMTDVMNQLYDGYDKATNVNCFMIELAFAEYGQVGEITVPGEVVNSIY